jgi:hypothetical protein
MHRNIEQWATDAANHVQYACNLSGIVFSFEQCVADLTEEAVRLGKSDGWINRHPIVVLWADKIDDLSRSRGAEPLPTNEPLTTLVPQFVAVMREVCDEAESLGHGTDWRNQHPKVQELVRMLVTVTGSREGMTVFNAFASCEKLARREAIKTGE